MLLKLRYEVGKYVRVFFDYLVSILSPCNAFEVSKFISLSLYNIPCTKDERISSVNGSKSAVTCKFGHIYWKNP